MIRYDPGRPARNWLLFWGGATIYMLAFALFVWWARFNLHGGRP